MRESIALDGNCVDLYVVKLNRTDHTCYWAILGNWVRIWSVVLYWDDLKVKLELKNANSCVSFFGILRMLTPIRSCVRGLPPASVGTKKSVACGSQPYRLCISSKPSIGLKYTSIRSLLIDICLQRCKDFRCSARQYPISFHHEIMPTRPRNKEMSPRWFDPRSKTSWGKSEEVILPKARNFTVN